MEKSYLISKEDFFQLKEDWKKENRTASEMIMYNILRSKDPKSGFTQKTKNIQGNDPWFGWNSAVRYIKWNLRNNRVDPMFMKFKALLEENLP